MKFFLSLILLSFSLSISMTTLAQTPYSIVKVKELGPMRNKIIFQSLDLKKIKGTSVLKGKLVARWGTQVFEVVDGFYQCNKNNVCRLTDYNRIATFESCIVKNNKVACKNNLASDSTWTGSSDVKIDSSPDSTDDSSRDISSPDSSVDFPARITDEFSDIF